MVGFPKCAGDDVEEHGCDQVGTHLLITHRFEGERVDRRACPMHVTRLPRLLGWESWTVLDLEGHYLELEALEAVAEDNEFESQRDAAIEDEREGAEPF